MRFKTAYDSAATTQQQILVSMTFPSLFWAYNIFVDPFKCRLRWAIEAYILARQNDKAIAQRLGSEHDIVKTYEALFYSVRERLNHPEYIYNIAMGSAVQERLQIRDTGLIWKIMGYAGGPQLVASLSGHLVNPTWSDRAEDTSAFLQDAAIGSIKKNAALSAMTIPVNAGTDLALIDALVRYVEVDRSTAGGAGTAGQDQLVNNIGACLAALPFRVGGSIQDTRVSIELETIERSSVELSGRELLLLATGRGIPGQYLLEQLSFPKEVTDADAQQGS